MAAPARRTRALVKSVLAELASEGVIVPVTKLCRWLGVSRRSYYYKPKKRRVVVDEHKAQAVKGVIERFPTYGYRRIACLLGWNRKVVQRICQLKGWQVRKRSRGQRPRVRTLLSAAGARDERWATDIARIWCGRDRWCHIALVMDCGSRELLGWRLSSRGNAATAEAALEEALIYRFGHVGYVYPSLLLRSDNGLVFTSARYTATVKAYGLRQEFITPYSPEQNGIIERFIRILKEECVWHHRFETLRHARSVIGQWIRYYNTERPHQALGYRPPTQFAA